MIYGQGEIVLAFFPHASGGVAKKRPVLIVQSDHYNVRMANRLVAEITGNLAHSADPASVLVDVATTEGKASGLLKSSVISCLNLATIHECRIDRVIGRISPNLWLQVEVSLKTALGLK